MTLSLPKDASRPGAARDAATPRERVTVFAPAGVGNVAVGFDVLGHALEAIGDRITVARLERPVVEIAEITGCDARLPLEPERNTAGAGLLAMVEELKLPFGFSVRIEKAIPLGSGMGGSAASAVGAVVAANALLDAPLAPLELLRYTLVGEMVASGSAHADNLAPGLLGGLTLVRSMDPPDVVRIPVPDEIRCVLVRPHLRIDTRMARGLLPGEVPLRLHVDQSADLAAFVAGCFSGDLELIRRSFRDRVAEPNRQHLIPGFAATKAAALEADALGCSISGGGPAMFAWCAGDRVAERVRDAMLSALAGAGVAADAWVSRVNAEGARILEQE